MTTVLPPRGKSLLLLWYSSTYCLPTPNPGIKWRRPPWGSSFTLEIRISSGQRGWQWEDTIKATSSCHSQLLCAGRGLGSAVLLNRALQNSDRCNRQRELLSECCESKSYQCCFPDSNQDPFWESIRPLGQCSWVCVNQGRNRGLEQVLYRYGHC